MLTMYTAVDALEKYRTKHAISNGDTWLRGARAGDDCPADCLKVVEYGNKVVCSSEGDFIEVQGVESDEILNALLDASDSISNFEISSMGLMSESSVEPLLNLLSSSCGCPAMLVDGHTMMCTTSSDDFSGIIPKWGANQTSGRLPWSFLEFMEHDMTYVQKLSLPEDKPFAAILGSTKIKTGVCRIRTPENGGVTYLFLLGTRHAITPGRLQFMQLATEKVQMWIESHLGEDRLFGKNDFLTRLASGEEMDQDEINENKRLLDLRSHNYVLARVEFPRDRTLAWAAIAVQDKVANCTCFEFEGNLYALCSVRDGLQEAMGELAEANNMRFGLSWAFSDWNVISDAVGQTEVALAASSDQVAALNSHCVLYYIFEILLSSTRNIDISHPAIEFLAKYDEAHKSEYLLTLWSYLRHERNLVRTAEALNIHRNSLVYRIKRIGELVEDMDLDDPEVREHLMISFRLRGLKSWDE